MSGITGILLLVAILALWAGWMLHGTWTDQRTAKRIASLIFTISCIYFVCFVIGDFLGEKQILALFR